MELLTKIIRVSRPNVKDITIKNYVNFLNRISKAVSGKPLTNLNFLKDVDKVKDFLDGLSFNSMRSSLTSIIVGLKAVQDPHSVLLQYVELFLKAKNEYYEKLGTKEKSEKTIENWTTMKALLKVQKSWRKKILENHIDEKQGLTKKNQNILQNYLIASLYTLQPPRRGIYGIVKLITTTEFKKLQGSELKENYLVFSNSFRIVYFYFGNQKSAKESINNPIQKPSKKLKKVLELFLRFNHGREYLLTNNRGTMLGLDGLGRHLIEIFGIGSTMIRKIYISENTKVAHDLIDTIASKMGHSSSMARSSYLKT